MQKSEKFFIFTWKELTVIGLLLLTTVGFFFTLGLHYGKRLHEETHSEEVAEKVEQSPEAVPSKDTLEEGAKHSESATQDSIKAATEEEISHSGLKVEQPKAVDLPSEKVAEKPASHADAHAEKSAKDVPAAKTKLPMRAAAEKAAAEGEEKAEEKPAEKAADKTKAKFSIQLGSYPDKKEAQLKIHSLSKRGLHPEVRTAQVNGQTRYRVVLPGFKTKASADARGKELHSGRKIENFVVIKSE